MNALKNRALHVYYKEPFYKEIINRRSKNLREISIKGKISKERFNFEYFYDCKQSRIGNAREALIWCPENNTEAQKAMIFGIFL